MRRWRVLTTLQKCSAKTRTVCGRRGALPAGWLAGGSPAAENGSVAVKIRPSMPTRAQSEVEAQEAAKSAFRGGCISSSFSVGRKGTRFSKCHESAPPVGSVEVRTSPLLSTATQRLAVGQEMPVICTEPPAFASSQPAGPAAGAVEVRTLPVKLPAAQSRVDRQATPSRSPGPPGVPVSVQAEAPPVGLVETKIRPLRAT